MGSELSGNVGVSEQVRFEKWQRVYGADVCRERVPELRSRSAEGSTPHGHERGHRELESGRGVQ